MNDETMWFDGERLKTDIEREVAPRLQRVLNDVLGDVTYRFALMISVSASEPGKADGGSFALTNLEEHEYPVFLEQMVVAVPREPTDA